LELSDYTPAYPAYRQAGAGREKISPPFGLQPRAVSDPEGKGRLGGILQDDFKQLN